MSADKVQFQPIFQYKNVIPLSEARRREDEKRKKLLSNLGGILTGRTGLFQPCSNAHGFRHALSSRYQSAPISGGQTRLPSFHHQAKSSDGHGTQSLPHQQRQRLNGQGTRLSSPQQRQRSERLHMSYLPRLHTFGSAERRTWTSAYEKPKTPGQISPIAASLPPAPLNSVISDRSESLKIERRSRLRAVGKGSRSHGRYQSGIPGKGSVISSADMQRQGHRKKCPCNQDVRVHNEEVREVGGLVCTARCFHHAHKSCLYKVNFCQAASVYLPFDLYKWKKIPKTPTVGIHQNPNFIQPLDIFRLMNWKIPKTPTVGIHQNPSQLKVVAGKENKEVTKQNQYDTFAYVKLRSLLPEVEKGEQVLFKSPDDGWYYHGAVLQNCQNNLYVVNDVNGHQKEIWREDIIRQRDLKTNIKVGQVVLAEHPDYPHSYAPGKVMSVSHDGMSVTMYDGMKTEVTTAYVALVPAKHNKDVADIKALAEQWVNQTVLTRNKIGEYHLARVVGLAATPHHYKVAWQQSARSNNSAKMVVEGIHLFGAFTPITPIQKNDYVLAPIQADKSPCYLPARVTKSGSSLKVTFVDRSRRDVEESACFLISSSYYMDAASNYIHWRQRAVKSIR